MQILTGLTLHSIVKLNLYELNISNRGRGLQTGLKKSQDLITHYLQENYS